MENSDDVLNFWQAAGAQKWWKKDAGFDSEIRARFGEAHTKAAKGELDSWTDEPASALALILILDQFSRNLFRNSALAFAQDNKALAIAKAAIAKGFDRKMPKEIYPFCYLPLMHSEVLADQEQCLALMHNVAGEGYVKAAQEHLDIIQRFGRFPHRNTVLGRTSTPHELEFLASGGFSG